MIFHMVCQRRSSSTTSRSSTRPSSRPRSPRRLVPNEAAGKREWFHISGDAAVIRGADRRLARMRLVRSQVRAGRERKARVLLHVMPHGGVEGAAQEGELQLVLRVEAPSGGAR